MHHNRLPTPPGGCIGNETSNNKSNSENENGRSTPSSDSTGQLTRVIEWFLHRWRCKPWYAALLRILQAKNRPFFPELKMHFLKRVYCYQRWTQPRECEPGRSARKEITHRPLRESNFKPPSSRYSDTLESELHSEFKDNFSSLK